MATTTLHQQRRASADHTTSHLFMPVEAPPTEEDILCESVLPDQFFHPPMGARAESPELSLVRTVLEDAIRCYQRQFISSSRATRRLAREAEEWIFSNDTAWPFAFVNLCEALAIEPDYVRRALRQQREARNGHPLQHQRQLGISKRTLKIAA